MKKEIFKHNKKKNKINHEFYLKSLNEVKLTGIFAWVFHLNLLVWFFATVIEFLLYLSQL